MTIVQQYVKYEYTVSLASRITWTVARGVVHIHAPAPEVAHIAIFLKKLDKIKKIKRTFILKK